MTTDLGLSMDERSALAKYESTIADGLDTFFAVGAAFKAIKADRLYREKYASWDDYCADRWGFSGRKANYWIAGARAAEQIAQTGTTVPASEWQVRPVANDPDVADIWADAVTQYGDQPTQKQVQETKIKRQVYGAGLAPVIQKMETGVISPKQALVLSDTLAGCEPKVRGDMLLRGVTDPAVVRKMNDLGKRGSETYREIVTTGYIQFTGEDDAVPLPQATPTDLSRLLSEKAQQHRDERFGNLQPVTITLFAGDPGRTIKDLEKLNLPPHYLDVLVTVGMAL